MFEGKIILRLKFINASGEVSFSHYIVSSRVSVPLSDDVDVLKEFVKSLPDVVLCSESLNELSGVDLFNICNDCEV